MKIFLMLVRFVVLSLLLGFIMTFLMALSRLALLCHEIGDSPA